MIDLKVYVMTSIVLSGTALLLACVAITLWVANKLSTHRIEWRTIGLNDAQDAETLNRKLNEPYEEEEWDSI